MNIHDPKKKCRYCGQDVSGAISQGESLCPSCGRSFTNGYNSNLSRKWLSVLFWVIFLTTPVLTVLTMPFGLGIPILITGTFIAGNLLSKLFAKSSSNYVVMTIAFTFLLFVVYGGIAFAGCLVAMSGSHF